MKFLAAIMSFLLAVAPVAAAQSEAERIIVHCASLTSDDVRLACFDAVVALTQQGGSAPARPVTGVTISEDVFAGLQHDASNYSGFYVGGGAQTGFGPSLNLFNGPGSGVQPFEHSSPAWQAFAGYNWTIDGYLVGVEASAAGDIFPESVYNGGFEYMQETLAPTVSARAGMELQEILLFARAGVGASFLRIFDTRFPNTDDNYLFPALSAGLGAEINFDNIFLRVDGEARHVLITPDSTINFDPRDSLTTYRAGVGLGLRF